MNWDIDDYLEGKFIIAMPGMGDQRFEQSVIYICAHSDDGAMGFMVNRKVKTPNIEDFFEQLGLIVEEEKADLAPNIEKIDLHSGGPVEPGRGFVLHTPDFKGDTTLEIEENICLTATLEILRKIVTGQGPEQFMVALGYAGWSSGQLEEEIASNGWLICPSDPQIVYHKNQDDKYKNALNLLGIDPALLSGDLGHA